MTNLDHFDITHLDRVDLDLDPDIDLAVGLDLDVDAVPRIVPVKPIKRRAPRITSTSTSSLLAFLLTLSSTTVTFSR